MGHYCTSYNKRCKIEKAVACFLVSATVHWCFGVVLGGPCLVSLSCVLRLVRQLHEKACEKGKSGNLGNVYSHVRLTNI